MESGLPLGFNSLTTPIFSICGLQDQERASFLNALLEALAGRGLETVIVRGYSSDRGRYELITGKGTSDLVSDLILIDGPSPSSAPILRLGEGPSSPQDGSVLQSFGEKGRLESVLAFLLDHLSGIWQQTPVWACVLIGGRSSRMGRPKHLITDDNGVTWLHRTVNLLQPLVDGVVLSGKGLVPEELGEVIRLPDTPGVVGPLAGILSAMRWYPAASWILLGCDMPDIMEEALTWLLSRRQPGIWGILPRLQKNSPVEPLLAYYDFHCRYLFEDLARRGCMQIRKVVENPKIETPLVPKKLLPSWRNVNYPADL